MRVLIVEDDAATAQTMELMLMSEGFVVQTTDLGEEAIDLAWVYDYDIVTLDLNLPDMTGFDVLRTIRAARNKTPVMVVTGSSDIAGKVKAFSLGADDYMTKPFHKDELVARIHAVTRRAAGLAESVICIGDLTISLSNKTATVHGRPVHLTGREYQMLELLALKRGAALTKQAFMDHLYGGIDEPELKIVDVFVCKLRKKLRDAGAGEPIRTAWGRGYFIKADEREAVEAAA